MSKDDKKDIQTGLHGLLVEDEATAILDIPDGLTPRQKRIVKYRLRGLSQPAIAKIEQVSQPMIAKEIRKIKEAFAAQGREIDQEVAVGETINLYDEVQQRAWDLHYNAIANVKKDGKLDTRSVSIATKILDTIMNAQERKMKLLMDLGLIKRAAVEHTHNVTVPFLEKWQAKSDAEKNNLTAQIITADFKKLAEPEPPEEAEVVEWPDSDDEDSSS